MVLFCLNQTGNHIPNPFNHSAMSLFPSFNTAHHPWQWQEDLQDGIYFREMDVSAPCVTSEGKYLQAEKYPQKQSLLVAVFGSKADILLLGLDFFLKIDVWEKMPISFHLALSSPHHPYLHSNSVWSQDRYCSLESAKTETGLGIHLWNFTGIWTLGRPPMSWHQATLLLSCPCLGPPGVENPLGKLCFCIPQWADDLWGKLLFWFLFTLYFLLIFYNAKSGTPHTEYEDSNIVKLCSSTVLSAKRGSMSKGCFKSRVWGLAFSRRWSVPLVLKEEVRKQIANRWNDRKYRWPLKNVSLCGFTYICVFFFFFNSKYYSTLWSESC